MHIILTENRMNNEYRSLAKALEVVGFENATVRRNVATYSFNSRLSSFNRLDISALDNLCKDLKKGSEDDESNLDFGLQQEVLLKGLMHFVQDLARVGKSVENIHPDEITLEAIDNAIEHAKNMGLLLSNPNLSQLQVIQVNLIRVNNGSPGVIVLSIIYPLSQVHPESLCPT